MKIKTVCEITGLTDRAVRYYNEEKLISPAYTENDLGRKSFDFSESDIQQLQDIAAFHKPYILMPITNPYPQRIYAESSGVFIFCGNGDSTSPKTASQTQSEISPQPCWAK